jgi:uncharacterized lipoprotein YmbA
MMRYGLIGMVVCFLLGCSAQPTMTERYTLVPKISASDSTSASNAPVEHKNLEGGLGIGPIELPEYLKQKEIVVFSQTHTLGTSAQHLWAGDLRLMLSRVMATNLSERFSSSHIWAHPWDARIKPKRQILVVIESLGGALGSDVTLVAKWVLLDQYGQKTLVNERQTFTQKSPDVSYAAYVQTINRLLDEASHAIGNSIQQYY